MDALLVGTLVDAAADRSLSLAFAVVLVALSAALGVGWLLGRRQRAAAATEGSGLVVGGLLALLAFFLGIGVSLSDGRFEAARQSILAEANLIGATWLFAKLVEGPDGVRLRELMIEYAQARLAASTANEPEAVLAEAQAQTDRLRPALWDVAGRIERAAPGPATAQLTGSLNAMLIAATTQRQSFTSRVPPHIVRLLSAISLIAAAALGYHLGRLGPPPRALLAALLLAWTAAILLVADLQRPRSGFVVVHNEAMRWTLAGMTEPDRPAGGAAEPGG